MNEPPKIIEKTYKYRVDTAMVTELVSALAEFESAINPTRVISIEVRDGWATVTESVKS